MNYKYNDNTLIHSVGLNIVKLESIMKNGILSQSRASELNIPYARNYDGFNLNNGISFARYLYINPYVSDSAYVKFIEEGISFIVENIDFTSDSETEKRIHNPDEVVVNDEVQTNKITGIIVPEEYQNLTLDNLYPIPHDSKNIHNIHDICKNLILYLEKYHYFVDYNEYTPYLDDLKTVNKVVRQYKDNNDTTSIDYQETINDYYDIINDLNEFMASQIYNCFHLYFKKDVTILELVEYLNKKYLNVPVYDLPFEKRKIKSNGR